MSIESGKKFRENNPWYESYRCAWRRCTDVKHKSFGRYGGRGIKFRLLKEDVKYLWERDKAYLLDKPRLDRINVDKDYVIENCRFISEAENLARMHDNAATPAEWSD